MIKAFVGRAGEVRDHLYFERTVFGLILAAALLVGLETVPALASRMGPALVGADRLLLGLFTLELGIRYVAAGGRPGRFLRDGWNLFDTVVVLLCYLPESGALAPLARLARVLRLLRFIEALPRLQVLLVGILRSLPSMGYIALLLLLLFYAYGVLGVFLFRGNDPGHFGHLGSAFTTLLRVVTLEDWTDVMYTAFHGSHVYPAQGPQPQGSAPEAFGIWAIVYFASFVLLGAMVMLNLFIGVVLTSLTEAHAEQFERTLEKAAAKDPRAALTESLSRVEAELSRLRRQLETGPAPADRTEAPARADAEKVESTAP